MTCRKVSGGSYLIREPKRNGKFQIVFNNSLKQRGYVPESGSEIFISKIPEWVEERCLVDFFNRVGEIFQFRLMMNEDFVTNRGYCYITYMNARTAKKAVDTLGELKFMGRRLLIEQSLNNCRLFLSGFPTNKTKDQIWMELETKGVRNIVDVIMYRSYSNRAENRGFVFVEFRTHEQAANTRAKFANNLKLWGNDVVVDWSVPVPQTDNAILQKVTIIYMRNLEVTQTVEELESVITRHVSADLLQKVYKFKNYAFVHLPTRQDAENLMKRLHEYYINTEVELEWARPPNKYTSSNYRMRRVSSMSPVNFLRNRSASISSDSSTSISPMNETKSPRSRQFSDSGSSTSGTVEQSLMLECSDIENGFVRRRLYRQENFAPRQDNFVVTSSVDERQTSGISLPSSNHEVFGNQPMHSNHLAKKGQLPVAKPREDYMTSDNVRSNDCLEYSDGRPNCILEDLRNTKPPQESQNTRCHLCGNGNKLGHELNNSSILEYQKVTAEFARNGKYVTEDDLLIIPRYFLGWEDLSNFIGDIL